jgi:sporulation protein YlmC with PRC-barrel domain
MAAPQASRLIRSLELQGLRVRTAGGRRLGRVYDLEAAPRPVESKGPTMVVALVVGRQGWMERVGLRTARMDSVPWSTVRRIEGGEIVVDDEVCAPG